MFSGLPPKADAICLSVNGLTLARRKVGSCDAPKKANGAIRAPELVPLTTENSEWYDFAIYGYFASAIGPRTRERRMIRDFILDGQPTKPTIGEVHLHITHKARSERIANT
jgi:hypothetical protein